MKSKLIPLLSALLLVSCGSYDTSDVSNNSDDTKDSDSIVSSAQISDQSKQEVGADESAEDPIDIEGKMDGKTFKLIYTQRKEVEPSEAVSAVFTGLNTFTENDLEQFDKAVLSYVVNTAEKFKIEAYVENKALVVSRETIYVYDDKYEPSIEKYCQINNIPSSTQKSTANKNDDAESEAVEPTQNGTYEITDQVLHLYKNEYSEEYRYFGIVEITNTGSTNLKLSDGSFSFEDNNGHLLQVDNMVSSVPDIIAPGEKGYFYTGYGTGPETVDSGVSIDNGFNLVPDLKIQETEKTFIDYEITDTSLKSDDFGGVSVAGRLRNPTEKDCSHLYIEMLLFDKDDRILYISGTNLSDIPAGSQVNFDFSTLYTSSMFSIDDVESYIVVARDY